MEKQFIKLNHSALIVLRGVKAEELNCIIDFIYSGEANVFHENLESFLAIAEELKLKGLMGEQTEKIDRGEHYVGGFKPPQMEMEPKAIVKKETKINKEEIAATNFPKVSAAQPEELYEQVRAMMEKSGKMIQNGITNGKAKQKRAFICKACGKEGAKQAIVDHIELHHLEGVALPCNNCQKTFRSTRNLRDHKATNHRKQFPECFSSVSI